MTPETPAHPSPVTWRNHGRLLLCWAVVGALLLGVSLVLWPPSQHGHALPLQLFIVPGLLLQPLLSTVLFSLLRGVGVQVTRPWLHVLHVLALVGYVPLAMMEAQSLSFDLRGRAAARGICEDVTVHRWRLTRAENAEAPTLEVTVSSRAGGPLRLDYPLAYDGAGSYTGVGCTEPGCETGPVTLPAGQQVTLVHGMDELKPGTRTLQFTLCRRPATEECAWYIHGDGPSGAGDNGRTCALPPPYGGWPP